MGKQLIITEKPSVARDIGAALGGFEKHDEYLESPDYVMTWALGHLLELAEPQDYDKAYRSWSIKNLPIIPEEFRIKPREGQKKRLDHIQKLGRRKDVQGLINACDAGREGEMIYRRIVEFTKLGGLPQRRLWLQSMTHEGIREAFGRLRDGRELDPLGDAAFLRAVGDWLIGMNATRALTQRLKSRGETGSWSAGRVQTPTLFLLVAREREILAHVPQPYWEIHGHFEHEGQTWEGRYYDPSVKTSDARPHDRPSRIFDPAWKDRVMKALSQPTAGVASETRKPTKQAPPLPFDLTSLQREANRRYSFSAKRTLDAAQRLYEHHKLLTYPRTDSRHLPDDYGPTVTNVLGALSSDMEYQGLASGILASGPQNLDRILDGSKVSDHFAIVPTGTEPTTSLSPDDQRVYDLAVRQFLAALMGPATFEMVDRQVAVPVENDRVLFRTTTKQLVVPGFLEAFGQTAGQGSSLPPLVPGSTKASGVSVRLLRVEEEAKETRPPARYTEAQLLRMMETAGELVQDEELSDAMSGRGLGTPATRAEIIERLVTIAYARRIDGALAPTAKAMRLMDVLERVDVPVLASPRLTGQTEFLLGQVAAGHEARDKVLQRLIRFTKEITTTLTQFQHDALYSKDEPLGPCPSCGSGVVRESAWGYRCSRNTGKEGPCSFILWKDRMGRYIDKKLARDLLEKRSVGPLDGFVAGRRSTTGTLVLGPNGETGRWQLEVKFDTGPSQGEADAGPENAVARLWACPEHEGCHIVQTNRRFVCERLLGGVVQRGPMLPLFVCQREMQPDEIRAYFEEGGKTQILEGFVSKRGRPFKGALFRKVTGKHGFEFPPRERKGRKGAAEADTPRRTKGAAPKARKAAAGTAAPKARKAAAPKARKAAAPKAAQKGKKVAAPKDAPKARKSAAPRAGKAAATATAPKAGKAAAPKVRKPAAPKAKEAARSG